MHAPSVYTPLRRRADFRRLHGQGQRKSDVRLQVRVLRRPDNPPWAAPIRLGILVTKKYGPAVERNRFKRLVRTAIRALAPELAPGWDILVLPRAARDAKMQDVLASLSAVLAALGVLRPHQDGGSA